MRLGAVHYDKRDGAAVDALLAEAARILKADSVRLGGAIQWNDPLPGRTRCSMTLEDLASGARTLATEDRGPLAEGCTLDVSALEEAAMLAAASIEKGVDLVIINRFGKQEAAGRGFRQVIEAAIMAERPVLLALSDYNKESWESFAGEEADAVACALDEVVSWCRAALRAEHS